MAWTKNNFKVCVVQTPYFNRRIWISVNLILQPQGETFIHNVSKVTAHNYNISEDVSSIKIIEQFREPQCKEIGNWSSG